MVINHFPRVAMGPIANRNAYFGPIPTVSGHDASVKLCVICIYDHASVRFGDAPPEVLRDLRIQERIARNVEAERTAAAERVCAEKRREEAAAAAEAAKKELAEKRREEAAAAKRARRASVAPTNNKLIDYYTLGFFAVRGILSVNVAHKAENTFTEMYLMYTGEDPAESKQGYTLLEPDAQKWGINFRISFDASAAELESLRVWVDARISKDNQRPSDHYITHNALGVDLLLRGFRLGAPNLEQIRENVPMQFRPEFERGVAVAKSARPAPIAAGA